LGGLSKNQKKILDFIKIKPDMTTREIAELVFGKVVVYQSKEYASVHRSLVNLERKGYIERVQIQLRWRTTSGKIPESPQVIKE
jgi:DNA-binding MarR family transcriptional regulator